MFNKSCVGNVPRVHFYCFKHINISACSDELFKNHCPSPWQRFEVHMLIIYLIKHFLAFSSSIPVAFEWTTVAARGATLEAASGI